MAKLLVFTCLLSISSLALGVGSVGDNITNVKGSGSAVFDLIITIGVIVGVSLVVFGFVLMAKNRNEGGDPGKAWRWVIIGSVVATPTIVMGLFSGTFFGESQLETNAIGQQYFGNGTGGGF